MKRKFLFFVVWLALPGLATAAVSTRYLNSKSVLVLSAEHPALSRKILERAAHLHPEYPSRLYLNSNIARCTSNPLYLPCGSRNLEDYNFLDNAEVNIDFADRRLRELGSITLPELTPLVEYYRKHLAYSIALDQRLLEFYRSGRMAPLTRAVQGIDPQLVTPELLRSIRRAADKKSLYWLTRHRWREAMLAAFRVGLGPMPADSWPRFVAAYGVETRIRPR